MNNKAIFAILFIAPAIQAKKPVKNSTKQLPVKFYGKFELDHSEGFDEYLIAKGYGSFERELVHAAKFEKEFKKTKKAGKFDYANITTLREVFYKDVELGKEFINEGMDFSTNKIMFYLDGNVLYEKHTPIKDEDGREEETFKYSFVKKGGKEYLLLTMKAGDAVAKRFYKRV